MKIGTVKFLGASLLLSACATLQPPSGEIPIKNAGFEADHLAEAGGSEKSWHFKMKDWGGYRQGIYNPSPEQFDAGAAPEGRNVGFLSHKGSYMAQILEQVILPNRHYDFRVLVGLRKESNFEPGSYTLQLFAGSALLTEKTAQMQERGKFFEDSLSYSTGFLLPEGQAGKPLKIVIRNVDTRQVTVDHIRLYSWNKQESFTPPPSAYQNQNPAQESKPSTEALAPKNAGTSNTQVPLTPTPTPEPQKNKSGTGVDANNFVGCWAWSNGDKVQINSDGTAKAKLFSGKWRKSTTSADYQITWPEIVDTLTLGENAREYQGVHLFGKKMSALKLSEQPGLEGEWHRSDGAVLNYLPSGTVTALNFKGQWESLGNNRYAVKWPIVDQISFAEGKNKIKAKNQFQQNTATRTSCL